MSRPARRPPITAPGALVAAVLALAAAAGTVPSPAGAAERCPARAHGVPDVVVSWGAEAEEETIDRPLRLPQGLAARAQRDGERILVVRTATAARGRRAPSVCAGSARIARLPTTDRRDRVVGASANGDRVAWRTARSARRGTLAVGRIRRGRVIAVRSVRTAPTGVLRQPDARIVVAPNGDVAWALSGSARDEPDRLWGWSHRGHPRRLPLARDHDVTTILLADDQHLFVDEDEQPLAFAPPRPGSCPRLVSGRWRPLGTWRVAIVDGLTVGGDSSSGAGWALVCDTASGRLLHVGQEGFSASHYCSEGSAIMRAARLGPWLVLEDRRTEAGSQCGSAIHWYGATVVDTRDGSTARADGGLAGPGVPAPTRVYDQDPQPEDAARRFGAWGGVVLAPGALSWAGPAEGLPGGTATRWPVTLADAAGTRRVGWTTEPSLALGPELRWSDSGTARAEAVAPAAEWTPVVARLRRP